MKRTARVTKPIPERTQPDRSWSNVFGSAPPAAPGAPAQAAGATEAVRRGVDLGYRVIDEYLKQGQAFARTASVPGASPGARPEDLPKMTERMFKYASDFASVWFDAMGMMMANSGATGGARPGMPNNPFFPSAPGSSSPSSSASSTASSPPAEPLKVSIEVASNRPARAAVEMDAASGGHPLAVPALRLQGGKTRLSGISINNADDGILAVTIRVPPKQTAGTYVGSLINERTNIPVGKLTVWIGA